MKQELLVYRQILLSMISCLEAMLKIELRVAAACFSDPSYLWEIGSAPLLTFILS